VRDGLVADFLLAVDAMESENTPCPCCYMSLDMAREPHPDYCTFWQRIVTLRASSPDPVAPERS
jgi:hypothetical protein